MTRLLIIILILSCTRLSGQDLKVLEQDLSQTVITDLKSIKEKSNKIFEIDPFNEVATYYLIESYSYTDNNILIPKFFQIKKELAPTNPKPYLLSAKYQFREFSLSDTLRLNELKIAIDLDKDNYDANYLLGVSYYQLFNERITRDTSILPIYYAKNSRDYLVRALKINSSLTGSLRYPITQLSYFINDTAILESLNKANIKVNENNMPQNGAFYFPIVDFAQLSINWKTNYSLDLIRIFDQTNFVLNWYSSHLFALKEPLIYNQKGKTIYRLTWLRTFHNPVAIRIENENNSFKLYWKVSNGAGGYDPGELTINETKDITHGDWQAFISLLKNINYWEMPTKEKEIMGTDGSQWILEGFENGKYHVVDRWTPRNSKYQECGKYLINLTGLKIPNKDFY